MILTHYRVDAQTFLDWESANRAAITYEATHYHAGTEICEYRNEGFFVLAKATSTHSSGWLTSNGI